MAQRACIRNVAGLQDVGEISYDLVRPILKKIDNPQQLKEIGTASPHIADHDAELWKAFIARDIPNWQDKIMEPKNPRSWWKIYRKLLKEEQRAKEAQEEQLRAAMTGIVKRREENQTQYVQKVIAEPARQTAFVDGNPNPNVRCWGESVIVKKPSLKNAKTGVQIISAIRRQGASAARQRGLIKPILPSARSQITRAPESMLRDYAKGSPAAVARQQALADGAKFGSVTPPTPKVFTSPLAPKTQHKALEVALRAEQAKKEERLKALASGSSKATVQSPPATPAKPMTNTSAPPRPETTLSPKTPASPAPLEEPRSALKAVADTTRRLSPSPAPPLVRKRPATPVSVFMPAKKRKI